MAQYDLQFHIEDNDPDSPTEWWLRVSTFEAMPEGLVCLAPAERLEIGPEEWNAQGPALWVRIDELRATLDRIEAMEQAGRPSPVPPSSARGLSVVE